MISETGFGPHLTPVDSAISLSTTLVNADEQFLPTTTSELSTDEFMRMLTNEDSRDPVLDFFTIIFTNYASRFEKLADRTLDAKKRIFLHLTLMGCRIETI